MRFFATFTLLFICLSFVQGQLVIPKIDDLNTVLSSSQFQQLLSVDKLQQLQNEIFTTIVTGLKNNWNIDTIAQVLEQLITQYVPQVNQMNIDWKAISQSALIHVATGLYNMLSGTPGGLVRKRDLGANELQLLSQLPMEKLAQLVEAATIPDRSTALVKLQQLLQQFFSNYQGRSDFDDLAEDLLDNLNNILPYFNPYVPPTSG